MLKNLFISQVRIELLNILFLFQDEEFYLRQLVQKIKCSPRSVNLELRNLESINLVHKRVSGKQHYYRINQQHPLFFDLRNIFLKTTGLTYVITDFFTSFSDNLDFLFVYGSMANGTFQSNSDVDVMIIGNISSRQIASHISELCQKLGREVNYSVFPITEVKNRVINKDHFFLSLLKSKKIFIIGGEYEFGRLVEEWLVEDSPDKSK